MKSTVVGSPSTPDPRRGDFTLELPIGAAPRASRPRRGPRASPAAQHPGGGRRTAHPALHAGHPRELGHTVEVASRRHLCARARPSRPVRRDHLRPAHAALFPGARCIQARAAGPAGRRAHHFRHRDTVRGDTLQFSKALGALPPQAFTLAEPARRAGPRLEATRLRGVRVLHSRLRRRNFGRSKPGPAAGPRAGP